MIVQPELPEFCSCNSLRLNNYFEYLILTALKSSRPAKICKFLPLIHFKQ